MSDVGFLLLLLFYSLVLISLGLVLSRRVKTTSDFFVAGRKLSGGLLFTTFLAANIGAGSTVGATGLGYQYGLSAWWWVGSAGIGSLLLAFFIGPRIYRLACAHNFYTVGDYLERRYDRRVRLLFAAVLWVGSLTILAGQLIAMAWILNVVAGIGKPLGCLLGGVVVTAYFSAGGLFTAVWVNLLQLIVKMTGFLIAVPWALAAVGGWDALHARLASQFAASPGRPSIEAFFGFTGIGLQGVLSYALILIPSFLVSPGLLQKLYGARDEGAIRRGVGLQAAALLAYAFLPAVLGMVAMSAFPSLSNRELALPTVLKHLLPWWLGALLLAAVFSAEISAADAVLFMLSTSVAKDFYQTLRKQPLDDAGLLRATRRTALAAGAAGTVVAILLPSVIDALTVFYGLLTVVLLVPLLAGLYSQRPTATAALATMLASLATMLVSLAVTLAVHLATGAKSWSILRPLAYGILAGGLTMAITTLVPSSKFQVPSK